MDSYEQIDQFQIMEEKIDKLIKVVMELRNENGSLTEMFDLQEVKIGELNSEIEKYKSDREEARQRISSLLEKLEGI